jgi:hypothetical protein
MATKKQATKKTAIPSDEKFENVDFDLFKAIEAIDKKDYGWFDTLTEDQQKKFVPYMMLHWISAVKATGMLGAYYVMSTDANANKYMFNERVQQHPKLQWLMLCAASPGMGKQFHQWIPHLKAKFGTLEEQATKKDAREYFEKVYATASKDDIDLITGHYVGEQNHQYRLSKLFPEMKIDDVRALAAVVTSEDIDKYEEEAGYR